MEVAAVAQGSHDSDLDQAERQILEAELMPGFGSEGEGVLGLLRWRLDPQAPRPSPDQGPVGGEV